MNLLAVHSLDFLQNPLNFLQSHMSEEAYHIFLIGCGVVVGVIFLIYIIGYLIDRLLDIKKE